MMEEELKDIVHYKPSPLITANDPRKSDHKKVILERTARYIVCGLVINNDKVLMIQEAIKSCYGKWYLPAGIVERNESLEEAVKREVKEEAGIDFEPEALILVECDSYDWIRFTYTGRIIGGELKTPAQADRESLQAQWLPVNEEEMKRNFRLRGLDCLTVIEHASKWNSKDIRYQQLTIPSHHEASCIRIVLIHNKTRVLVRKEPTGNTYLPCGLFNRNILNCISTILKESGYNGRYSIIGILTVEHLVTGGDGVGLTLLIEGKEESLSDGCAFYWSHIKDQYVLEHFDLCLKHVYMTVQASFD